MKKFLDYFLSLVFGIYFFLCLLIFDPIQRIAFNILGPNAHYRVVCALNFFLTKGIWLTGTSEHYTENYDLEKGKPYIFIANHKSMFDIVGMIWYLRKYHPLFVSKIELARGIPSISYNLKVGGAALIDRTDPRSAVVEIAKLGIKMEAHKFSAAIFPEGTRSKTENLKPFAVGGVATLLKKCPEAILVPIAIKGMHKFNPKGIFPLTSFSKVSWTLLKPILPSEGNVEELVKLAENQIKTELGL